MAWRRQIAFDGDGACLPRALALSFPVPESQSFAQSSVFQMSDASAQTQRPALAETGAHQAQTEYRLAASRAFRRPGRVKTASPHRAALAISWLQADLAAVRFELSQMTEVLQFFDSQTGRMTVWQAPDERAQ